MKRLFLFALTFVMTVSCMSVARAEADTLGATTSPSLEARIVLDSGGCPGVVEIWVHNLNDTLQGAEFVLYWDRPDYARFATDSIGAKDTQSALPKEFRSLGGASREIPVVDRSVGLMKTWDYVQARGADGLSIKITALAYVAAASGAQLIAPVDSGLLLSLPVQLPSDNSILAVDDSTSVRFAGPQTRLSDNHGNLVGELRFHESRVQIATCTARASGLPTR